MERWLEAAVGYEIQQDAEIYHAVCNVLRAARGQDTARLISAAQAYRKAIQDFRDSRQHEEVHGGLDDSDQT